MSLFIQFMELSPGMRVLDVGGQPATWREVQMPLNITIINLPGVVKPEEKVDQHRLRFIDGDACDMSDFGPGEFDIVYSNSVIEHVGGDDRQEALAREVRRLGARYWV
jgi:ubiquinone/menaquinone biosynthesis C-methylase UbiE